MIFYKYPLKIYTYAQNTLESENLSLTQTLKNKNLQLIFKV